METEDTMKNWIIKTMGGVPRPAFDRLYLLYTRQNEMITETIKVHNMQGAWKETNQARKRRRLH